MLVTDSRIFSENIKGCFLSSPSNDKSQWTLQLIILTAECILGAQHKCFPVNFFWQFTVCVFCLLYKNLNIFYIDLLLHSWRPIFPFSKIRLICLKRPFLAQEKLYRRSVLKWLLIFLPTPPSGASRWKWNGQHCCSSFWRWRRVNWTLTASSLGFWKVNRFYAVSRFWLQLRFAPILSDAMILWPTRSFLRKQ